MQPELNVQKFLRTTKNGIEELKNRFAIDAKRHSEYPNLVLFKYSQIASNFADPIVQECRGIVLDESDNWRVVCWSFSKFFNSNEPLAAKIDWSTAEVQEKKDGSLCQLYYYGNKWNVATSGTPDASGQVNDFGKSFKELFWETWNKYGTDTDYLNSDFCYAFELTGPFNRVVVDNKENELTVIGCRDLRNLQEFHLDYSPIQAIGIPRRFPLASVEDCIKAAEALNPMNQEGFVVVDANFNRIKIKSPAYVILHHAKDSLSKKRMCEIVRKGEFEEFKTAIESLPELKRVFEEVEQKHRYAIWSAETVFNMIKGVKNQKDFAVEANKTKYASVLFQMRKNNLSAAQALASPKMSIEHYMSLIGVK